MFELLSEYRAFGGVQRFYRHDSERIGLPMRFSVFLPRAAVQAPVPAVVYLAGLTCTEETFAIKAGAQRYAEEHGLALIAPDTSPRGAKVAGESDSWDLGVGAGFYVDATRQPWAGHYRMYSYLLDELLPAITHSLPIDRARIGIFGHSMGGHGALVLGLRNPEHFRSISAFAPISAPSRCAWGEKAFSAYLGPDRAAWAAYDASELVLHHALPGRRILIDQGLSDTFLRDGQLQPEVFEAACRKAGQPLELRRHEGYDHSYYFISTFIADHIAHHARQLGAA